MPRGGQMPPRVALVYWVHACVYAIGSMVLHGTAGVPQAQELAIRQEEAQDLEDLLFQVKHRGVCGGTISGLLWRHLVDPCALG